MAACRKNTGKTGGLFQGRITVDSSAFFSGGQKKGYGSSAAIAAGLSLALLSGQTRQLPDEKIYQTALLAHRAFQAGKGSGYDVAASLFGGIRIFSGGRRPHSRFIELPCPPELYLFGNDQPVSTKDAISRYRQWKRKYPREAADFLRKSNQTVITFSAAATREEMLQAFTDARNLGLYIGHASATPADFSTKAGILSAASPWYKALGAGNELGILIKEQTEPNPEIFQRLTISGGARWE